MSFSCNNHQIITFVSVLKVFRSFQCIQILVPGSRPSTKKVVEVIGGTAFQRASKGPKASVVNLSSYIKENSTLLILT